MANAELNWTQENARVGDADLIVERAGHGPPLLLFHEELGCPGTTQWQVEMAKTRTLIQVHHPGFSRSERVPWVESMRDLACFYAWYVRELGEGPIDVMGFSFGGWVAAEMAALPAGQSKALTIEHPSGGTPIIAEVGDDGSVTSTAVLRTARKLFDGRVFARN